MAEPRRVMALTEGEAPKVTVIVPHRDDLDGLARTLAGIAAVDAAGLTVEILVVDNASDCGLAAVEAVIARHPAIGPKLLTSPLAGAGPARNAAVVHARGAALAFIDCDCIPTRGWLTGGVMALGGAAVTGGPVIVEWDGALNAAAAFDLLFGFDVARSFRKHGHLLTSNLWVRADVFADVGAFRAGISEDVEWCHRATARGHRITYTPALAVRHRALADKTRLIARWRRITGETFAYHRETGGGVAAWTLYSAAVAASVLPHALRVLSDARVNGAALRLQTLALLIRIRMQRAWHGIVLVRSASSRRASFPSV